MLLTALFCGLALGFDMAGKAEQGGPGAAYLPDFGRVRVMESSLDGTFSGRPVAHWSRRLPGGRVKSASHSERARPVLSGDNVYVGGAGATGLYELSRYTGSVQRHFPAQAAVESEPLVLDDRVIFSDVSGRTYCFMLTGPEAGSEKWAHQGAVPILVRPTRDDGRIIVSNVDDLAVALDLETGDQVWRFQLQRDALRVAELALFASPAAVVAEDVVLLGFSDGTLVGVDRETGVERFSRRVGEGRYPDLVAEPVFSGSDLFVSGYFQPLVAIDLATRSVRWRAEVGAAFAVVVTEIGGAPTVLHPGTDGKLRALSVLTGAERWVWDSGETSALSGVLDTPAGLIVATGGGQLVLLDPETGLPTWAYDEGRLLNGIAATPFVEGRQLVFVTDGGRLISLVSNRDVKSAQPFTRFPWDRSEPLSQGAEPQLR